MINKNDKEKIKSQIILELLETKNLDVLVRADRIYNKIEKIINKNDVVIESKKDSIIIENNKSQLNIAGGKSSINATCNTTFKKYNKNNY